MGAARFQISTVFAACLLCACATSQPPAQDSVTVAVTRKADAVVASLGYADIPGQDGMVSYAGGFEHALVVPWPGVPAGNPAPAPDRQAVHFDVGRAALSSAEQEKLSNFLARLGVANIEAVLVEGHTDDAGSAAYNLRLSEARAAEVRRFLQGMGVPEGRIDAVGFGESLPAASNATEEGRAANRRADIKSSLNQ